MLTEDLVPLLWCPTCRASGLHAEEREATGQPLRDGTVVCSACGARYPLRRGIPELIPEPARRSEDWGLWRDHLEGYRARRQRVPSRGQSQRWREKARAFAAFVDPGKGRLLDVGCGTGEFRRSLGDAPITYVGLDPLPVEAEDFRFVQALAERIPFRDGTFERLVIRSALDHFWELDVFLREAGRVLAPEGRIFVEQVVHEIRGPRSMIQYAAHAAKDIVDDARTYQVRRGASKHLRSFTTRSLEQSVRSVFRVERTARYDAKWYLPTQVLLELRKP